MSDIPSDASTTAVLTADSFLRGTLEAVGDEDWLRIDIQAGQTYRFAWFAAMPDSGAGADFYLLNANGAAIVGTDNPGDWTDIFIQWTFTTSGTYFLAVGGAADAPIPGDYTVAANLLTNSPLDAIDWGTRLTAEPVDITFAPAGVTYETSYGPMTSLAWSDYLQTRELAVFAEYAKVANITFRPAAAPADAEITLVLYESDGYLETVFGFFGAPGYTYEGVGGVNGENPVWNPLPGGSVEQGGRDFSNMIHEAGHALGLAHPHDTGGASVIMQGVTSPDDAGNFELNQGIFTEMTYNDGWAEGPLGGVPRLPDGSLDRTFGYPGTPMALDIALIQLKYGANMTWATGDDIYVLPDTNGSGTFYACIWDAGGTDTISAGDAAIGCIIDLRAATLRYEVGGGGWVSYHDGIHGGFTIANGVVIENAIGSSAADIITGNAADNRIDARQGNDTTAGGAGADDFVFTFDIDTRTGFFRPNEDGTGGETPSGNANAIAWRTYVAKLAEWRAQLEDLHGADADTTTTTVTVKDGKGTATFTYDNSYSWATKFAGEAGDDLILDWDSADQLALPGMTKAELANVLSSGRLTVSVANVVGTADPDTVIAWATGSITLQDATLTAADLLSGAVVFA